MGLRHRKKGLFTLGALGIVAGCSESATTSEYRTVRQWVVSDAGAEERQGDAKPLHHVLQGLSLPDGKVPVLELQTAPSGNPYALFLSVHSLDGKAVTTESGFQELALGKPSSDGPEDLLLPDPSPIPKIDPAVRDQLAAGDAEVSVELWLKEPASPPLFLEVQKAVFRGDVETVGERRALHEQLLDARRAETGIRRAAVRQRLESAGAKIMYECTNSPCLIARVPATAIEQLEQDADVDLVTLQARSEGPSQATGGVVRTVSRLSFYPDEGYDGEGPVNGSGVQDESVLALVEVEDPDTGKGAPNEEHVGFKDGATSSGPRILTRTACIAEEAGQVTCVFPSTFPEANETDHATGVLGIALGDLIDAQDPTVSNTTTRRDLSGYANEADAHVLISAGGAMLSVLDQVPSKTPLSHVTNISAGTEEDANCTGTTARSRAVNDLFEAGVFVVKSSDNFGHASTTDCTVGSPGASIGAFVVGGYGDPDDDTVSELRTAFISDSSSRGGTTSQGNNRRIIDLVAPSCRLDMFDVGGGYDYAACGTSLAAPQVSALALDLIDWDRTRSGAQDLLTYNPGQLHSVLLLMGDRGGQGGTFLSGGDNLYGLGRLRARAFTNLGMDSPWFMHMSVTCVGSSPVEIPINHTPIADIDVVKVAIFWYDARHETGGPIDNIDLRLVNDATGATIRSSTLSNNEYEFLVARQGFNGTDVIQNVPLKLVLDPISVTADNAGCGTNAMMVWYSYFFEDSNRDDPEGPTLGQVPRE